MAAETGDSSILDKLADSAIDLVDHHNKLVKSGRGNEAREAIDAIHHLMESCFRIEHDAVDRAEELTNRTGSIFTAAKDQEPGPERAMP